MSPEEIAGFLNTNTGKALPQNVAHSIADWARMLKRLTIQRVTLIQVDDPAVLDELLASRKTRRMVLLRLSPTTAIANLPDVSESAREDAWQRLAKELRGAGYVPNLLPEQTGTDDAQAPAKAKPLRRQATDAGPRQEPGRPRTRATRTTRTATSTTRRTGTS